jgi:hypothetical protein
VYHFCGHLVNIKSYKSQKKDLCLSNGFWISLSSIALLAMILLLLLSGPVSSLEGLPLDDSWIHLCYARSIAQTGTFAYNPYQWENGNTAPLWALLLAIPVKLGIHPVAGAKVLGFFSGISLLYAIFLIGNSWVSRSVGLIALGLALADPWLTILSVSGMEPLAALSCALFAIHSLKKKRFWWTGVFLSCSLLFRPELAIVLVFALVFSGNFRNSLKIIILPGLTIIIWGLYGLIVTGHILPNTYYIKTGLPIHLLNQLKSIYIFFSEGWALGSIVTLFFVVFGLFQLLKREGKTGMILLLTPLSLIIFYVTKMNLGIYYGPFDTASVQNIYYGRYLFLCIPWLIILMAIGIIEVFYVIQKKIKTLHSILIIIGVFLIFTLPACVEQHMIRHNVYHANCHEIERLQVFAGKWINYHLPADSVIGVSDAGAIRFFANQRIIDFMGLNCQQMLNEKDKINWLQKQKMSHAAIWPIWHKEIQTDTRLKWKYIGSFTVERNTISPIRELRLYHIQTSLDIK